MKEIPLSINSKKNRGKYFALVDDEDYDWLCQWRWSATIPKNKDIVYAQTNIYINGRKIGTMLMHRAIKKTLSGVLVDHADRNGLNNQRGNLREATHGQNSANRRAKRGGTSKYLGVYYEISKKKWAAKIWNGKEEYLGRYTEEKDAAKAYNDAAIIIHGSFANLNIL